MPKSKDNFLLSIKHRKLIDNLEYEDAGKLFKNIYSYAENKTYDLNGALESVFLVFKDYIDFNEEKYLKRKKYDKERQEENDFYSHENDVNKCENDSFHNLSITHNIYNSNLEDNRGVIGEKEETFISADDTSMLGETGIDGNEVADDVSLLIETTKKIINYLNDKAETKYRSSSKSTQKKIKARLNEGRKLDDFIVVIDKKCAEWKGTEFEKFLCPETLFGSKFEKYLNQKIIKNQQKTNRINVNPVPDWFNKNVKSEAVTEEELAELKEMLKV